MTQGGKSTVRSGDLVVSLVVALAAVVATIPRASAQGAARPAAEFYAGKTITLLIGFGSGGGNDTWARLVARHIGRFIPGHPLVVPQNLPGGGGLLVANQLYNVSPKDGTVIALINRGIPMEPLLGGGGVKFDPLRFTYLGSPDRDTPICVARTDSGVTTLKDLFLKELVVGATGSGADSAVYPEFMALLRGLKFKVVKGYKGSNEVRLAMERGEVQGICGSTDSVMNSDIARSGRLAILFQATMTPDARLENVPLGSEGARTEPDRQVLELFFMRAALGRPFIAPPELPADRTRILRRAFNATMRDSKVREDASQLGLSLEPLTGEELTARVAQAFAMPGDVVKRTTEVLGRLK